MAIIKCPECQNDISDKASSCPHCGFSLHHKEEELERNAKRIKRIILGLILAAIGFYILAQGAYNIGYNL